MIIYEGVLVLGSCLADYAPMWTVILALWFLFFFFMYRARRRRGTAMEIAIWRWVGGGLSVVFVAIAVGFAFSERKTVRVVTIGNDLDIIGCVGVNRETARRPLTEVRFEYSSYRQSSQKSSTVVHGFQIWTLGKSRQLARFRANADGINLTALRKLAPDAVASYEQAKK